MKVYCGMNKKGIWKATLDEAKLSKFSNVFECEVDCIHNNKLYMIKTYYGFDYSYGAILKPFCDDVKYSSQMYVSASAAKKSEVWQKKENLAKKNPNEYHVTPFSIASDDGGEPFYYGDVMEGKFNMQIIGVKVI